MKSKYFSPALFLPTLLLCSLVACVPVAVGGGAAATTVGLKDKGFTGTFKDTKLSTAIRNHLSLRDNEEQTTLTRKIGIAVQNQEVLLTGHVDTEDEKMLTEQRVWEVNGVKSVINQIEVGDRIRTKTSFNDSRLTTIAKAKILGLDHVRSLNYSIKTVDGIMYIMGTSKSQEEQDKVTETLSRIKGVKKIVCLARFRGDLG